MTPWLPVYPWIFFLFSFKSYLSCSIFQWGWLAPFMSHWSQQGSREYLIPSRAEVFWSKAQLIYLRLIFLSVSCFILFFTGWEILAGEKFDEHTVLLLDMGWTPVQYLVFLIGNFMVAVLHGNEKVSPRKGLPMLFLEVNRQIWHLAYKARNL